MVTSFAAMIFCLFLLSTCSLKVEGHGQFGHFSQSSGSDGDITPFCIRYSGFEDSLDIDKQFRMAQVSALIVVPLGFIMCLVLVMAPFIRRLNGVWAKLLGVANSLVCGNLQLLSVAKFIRFFIDAFPDSDVRYDNRFIAFGSVFFWLLTAITISICGVKQKKIQYTRNVLSNEDEGVANDQESNKHKSHDEVLNITIEHDENEDIEISFSGETQVMNNESEDHGPDIVGISCNDHNEP